MAGRPVGGEADDREDERLLRAVGNAERFVGRDLDAREARTQPVHDRDVPGTSSGRDESLTPNDSTSRAIVLGR